MVIPVEMNRGLVDGGNENFKIGTGHVLPSPIPVPRACIYFYIILWMRESGRELVLGHNYPEIYLLTANLCNLLELYF